MRTIFIDAFSGASGDMILGALIDAGGDFAGLRAALSRLARGRFELRRRRVISSSLAATKIVVKITTKDETERNFREIASLVRRGRLPGPVRDLALEIFRRLCEAEAWVHGVPVERVHLHEAGAIDAIADICGAAWLFHSLGPARIVCSPLNVGSGTIECRHGTYPVPGPATARLLRGVPVYAEGAPGERVTPTGAAILMTVVSEFRPLPPIVARAIGHGAGDRVFPDRPNILRVIIGGEGEGVQPFESGEARASAASLPAVFLPAQSMTAGPRVPPGVAPPRQTPARGAGLPADGGDVLVIETTIDDMNPQNYAFLLEKALSEGALEVYFTPVLMKKGRPGTQVTLIVPPAKFEAVSRLLFRETTTIGFRYRREARRELDRAMTTVKTRYGDVRLKVSSERGEVLQVQPEYEDCRRIAEARRIPLKEVQRLALAAWRPAQRRPAARRPAASHPAASRPVARPPAERRPAARRPAARKARASRIPGPARKAGGRAGSSSKTPSRRLRRR